MPTLILWDKYQGVVQLGHIKDCVFSHMWKVKRKKGRGGAAALMKTERRPVE